MAINDNAVFTAATGYLWTAPVGTAAPTPAELAAIDPEDWGTTEGYVSIGHTSEGDLPEFGFEGGDKEVRGTWQKKNLREVSTETPVDYLLIRAQQVDAATLAMYYGANAASTPGVFGVESSDAPALERALFLLLVDGDRRIGFHAPKTSIRREESIALATDEFATLPLRSTFMKETGHRLFDWILPHEVPTP